MYTESIGQIILDRWRAREGRPDTTAKEYFDEVFFPLFFDGNSNDDGYLMVANNSKFDQAYKQKKKTPLTAEVRRQALEDFHGAVSELTAHEGHLYMGGYSRSVEDPTVSQVTNLTVPLDEERTYLTWFGTAAGIGVKGGVSLLLSDPEVLDQLVEGWKWYRKYMSGNKSLKPHQIDTWNGWWLTMVNDPYGFDQSDPLKSIPADSLAHKNGISAFTTVKWSQLLFSLARNKPKGYNPLAYIYSFGQTNTSIGFIPLLIDQINKLSETHERLYGKVEYKEKFIQLYETEFGFISACRMGAIGLRALEPKNLKNYLPSSEGKTKTVKLNSADDELQFHFYKTWITAMLDNTTLLTRAKELAEKLNSIGPAARGKKTISSKVDEILNANSVKQLVKAFTDLLNEREFRDQKDFDPAIFQDVVSQIMELPASKVPFFLTLVRFESALLNFQK